jgi:hypothetical protein
MKSQRSGEFSDGGGTYFGIKAKDGVTIWNIMAIFLIQFFVITINNDYMSQT